MVLYSSSLRSGAHSCLRMCNSSLLEPSTRPLIHGEYAATTWCLQVHLAQNSLTVLLSKCFPPSVMNVSAAVNVLGRMVKAHWYQVLFPLRMHWETNFHAWLCSYWSAESWHDDKESDMAEIPRQSLTFEPSRVQVLARSVDKKVWLYLILSNLGDSRDHSYMWYRVVSTGTPVDHMTGSTG